METTEETQVSNASVSSEENLNISEITEEYLNNLHKDCLSMPACVERSILYLLYYLSLKLTDNYQMSDEIDIQIADELKKFQERLEMEEWNLPEISQLLSTISTNIKNQNWQSAYDLLKKKILKKIRPMDLCELFRLVDKANNAAVLIKDKKIIFLLGFTGSGKSTMIHFLAGSKMAQVLANGYYHIVPTEIKNHDLEQVKTSLKMTSETRYITPVTVNFSDVNGLNDGSVVLCDSPGFGDTEGAEVDIANGVGIIQAIKGCKSVKPVVLFSYKRIGDKCEGVKTLVHLLAGFMPSIKDHMSAFSYVFTKYPDQERKTISETLTAVYKDLTEDEKSDIGFTDVLKDMIKKTRTGGAQACALDPIKDDPGNLLDGLADLPAIANPDEVFKFSITAESRMTVQKQLQLDQKAIISATARADYQFVKYKLDNMKSLYNLLHEDYIEQIYNESIRYVNKHLSDAYQNATSTFDRCLNSQTALTTENIEQYQEYISHFQIVEQWKANHLGQQVVHSGAFLIHLNQSIKSMCADLLETDIDELSVKNSLDKIKLVSKSFLDIVSTYEQICQSLAEKYTSMIKSFQNSVRENQFTECANYIMKLTNARTNLAEHINFEQNIDLKNYFLDHLKDCVQDLEEILIKTKLNKADIDKLNNCLIILDSALKTFALEPYISLSSIGEIYTNLQSTILEYFNKLIKQIDIEQINEESFQLFEEIMQQLDLIRTIPMIETKTSESYWQTLEKIIGFVDKSRQSVEEQMRNLFGRTSKFDHDKFLQSLRSLKHAKWIEKYRKDVYANIIETVKKELTQHIDTAAKSLLKINLELDNFDQIQNVNDLVADINQMKAMEQFIGDISMSINNVNTWFEQAMNGIFIVIKNMFNIDKLTEQDNKPIDLSKANITIDLNKANKVCSFLTICKTMRLLIQIDYVSVLNNFEEFLRLYSDLIQKQMNSAYQIIKEFENQNTTENIFQQALILNKRLKELVDIETNYSRILDYFFNRKLVEQWKQVLTENLNELTDEIELLARAQQTVHLKNKLVIVKALSRLDGFLDDGVKYLVLYKKYQREFFDQTDNVHKQILDAINKYEYERVATEMAVLESSKDAGEHFLKQAKRALTISLETLMEETQNQAIVLGNHIKSEQISPIVENLKRLQRAKQFISQYVDNKDEIDTTINAVKLLIGDRLERILNNIRALVSNNSFNEAEKKIELILLIAKILGGYCPTTTSQQINSLQDGQQKAVDALVTKYSEMNIESYRLYPPKDIFIKFQEVSNTNTIYQEALNKVQQQIIKKFQDELTSAKEQMPPNLDNNNHIRRFESAVKYLPDDLRGSLEIDLQNSKDDISVNIKKNEEEFNRSLRSNNIADLEAVLKKYRDSKGNEFYINQIHDTIRKQIQELSELILKDLDNQKIADALNRIRKLHNYKMKFNEDVLDIQSIFHTVRTKIDSSFLESYIFFTNRFLNNFKSDISGDTIKLAKSSFTYLIEFMKFAYDEKGKPILDDIFTNQLIAQINDFQKQFIRFLDEQKRQIDAGFEKLSETLLKDSLDALQRWDSLIIEIKASDNIYKINDSSAVQLGNEIKKMTSYGQLMKAISDCLDKLRQELIEQDLLNEQTQGYKKSRNEFYQKLNDKLTFLQQAQVVVNRSRVEDECIESLRTKIEDISRLANDIIDKILSNAMFIGEVSVKFNIYYNNLLSFKQEIKIKSINIQNQIDDIENKVSSQIQTWVQLIETETSIDNIAKYLISMKRTSNYLPIFSESIKGEIDRTLQDCKSRKKSPVDLGKLGVILQQDEIGIGSSILSEHRAFEKFSISVFLKKTQGKGIDYILQKIRGDSIDPQLLKKRYDEFDPEYQKLIKQHLKSNMNLDALISDTKLFSGNLKIDPDSLTWDGNTRANIPKLAAYVFALWTLQNAGDYFEASSNNENNSYLRQPQAAQIVSIFRMLGIGEKNECLQNNLVQIGTGEGKSITLGATAAILALVGADVHCACYSEYLSERDYRAFLPLFDALGVSEYIHYGTFNKLCESVINENGNIRDKVEQFISKDSNTIGSSQQRNKRPKILLIDEVDVFFSKNFYGAVYTPSASLRDPTITELVNMIWKERKSKLTLKQIEETSQFQACLNRFANWKLLIIEAVKDLLFDVQKFESHNYIVKDDRIGYVEQDNIIYNVSYGYQTLFAYYCEHEKTKISKKKLEENIAIRIKCGNFSYAEIPLKFAYIIGVTGTLETLSDPEKQVIENDYKIKKNTYIPSIFGDNKLRFVEKDDIKLENDADYMMKIEREIAHQLVSRETDKRAIIVVFDSAQKLKDFYNSKVIESIKGSISYLTEEASAQEKDHLVRRATTSGQVTLITRTFGRGTDFVCHDQRVAAAGGVHVIQTFLSEEVSEEIQIKGRTARQADPGSYCLILNYSDLERFDIKIEDIQDIKKGKSVLVRLKNALLRDKTCETIYEYLNDKRTYRFKTHYNDNMQFVKQVKAQHELTQKFLVDLNSGDIDSIRKYLIEENKGAELKVSSRTICLMDATGSMSSLLHKAKTKVNEMVQRASEILTANSYNSNSFQIQFVVYRNYSCRKDKLLQASPWETKADNLRIFMDTIQPEGGMGNEAIEIGFQHANKEHEKEPVTQVILIGDAPPNTQEEVRQRRGNHGENYWKDTNFSQETYYENELDKLKSNNIPVHAFFVHTNAEQSFKKIADATKGRCEFLDINSEKGSEILTDFITEAVLQNIGGDNKGNVLVTAYREKFGKSYT